MRQSPSFVFTLNGESFACCLTTKPLANRLEETVLASPKNKVRSSFYIYSTLLPTSSMLSHAPLRNLMGLCKCDLFIEELLPDFSLKKKKQTRYYRSDYLSIYLFLKVLRIEPRALCMLGKHSPLNYTLFWTFFFKDRILLRPL